MRALPGQRTRTPAARWPRHTRRAAPATESLRTSLLVLLACAPPLLFDYERRRKGSHKSLPTWTGKHKKNGQRKEDRAGAHKKPTPPLRGTPPRRGQSNPRSGGVAQRAGVGLQECGLEAGGRATRGRGRRTGPGRLTPQYASHVRGGRENLLPLPWRERAGVRGNKQTEPLPKKRTIRKKHDRADGDRPGRAAGAELTGDQ